MKQWIILIVAVTILVGAGLFEISYLKCTSKYLLSDVYYSKQLIENRNVELAKNHYEDLKDTWENLKQPWGIFIDHDEIESLDESINKYKSYLEKEDDEEAYVEICEIERVVKHIVEKQEIEVGNIF